MKILFLTSRFPYPPNRGDRIRTFNFIKHLSKRHEILLASFIEESELKFIPEVEKHCSRVETAPLDKKRSYLNCLFHLFSSVPFQVFYYSSPRMTKIVSRLVKEEKPDLIHVHLFRMAPYAAKYGEIPKVLDLCDSITLNYERFLKYRRDLLSPAYWVEKMKVKNYEGRIPADFDRSLVVSAVDKDAILSYSQGSDRDFRVSQTIEVVPNGVDLDYFPGRGSARYEVLKYNPHRLIFTGTMSYFPNYDGIIYFYEHIFPLIRIKVPDVELYVVGRNPPKGIRGMSHDKSVTVTGFVPDVRPYVSAASVFVCPLRAATGLPIKILEAMAMGLPVVATSKALEGVNARSDQDVLVSDDPEEFASLVVKLLLDEDLRRKFSGRGHKLVERNYNWSKAVDKLDKIYQEVVK